MPKWIDVPATLNNCFFHCLAAHCLLNDIALPDEVFDLRDTPFEAFAFFIKDQTSFNKVFDVESQMRGLNDNSDPFMVEKMLLLGVMLRHYYVKSLQKLDKKDPFYQAILTTFLGHLDTVKEVAGEAGDIDETCRTTEDHLGLLLQSNRDYVVAYLKQQRELDYLPDVLDKQPEPAVYFEQTGFYQFISALKEGNHTLSISDLSVLTQILGIPVDCFSDEEKAEEALKQANGQVLIKDGHYFLKVEDNEQTKELQKSLRAYHIAREAILIDETNRQQKEEQAYQSSCLFLAATLPVEKEIKSTSPIESLRIRWQSMIDSQQVSLPIFTISHEVQAFLHAEKVQDISQLDRRVKIVMVNAFIDYEPEVIEKIRAIAQRLRDETKVYGRDFVLDKIIGDVTDEIEIQDRILKAIKADLMACETQQDYWAFKDKYAFLDANSLKALNMLIFFQKLIRDRENRFNALITSIADESLKQRLRDYYQALHDPGLPLSRKLVLYQLVLDTFAPLMNEKSNLLQFEARVQRLTLSAKQLAGHAIPRFKYVGTLMLAIAVAAGIALGIGTLGIGTAALLGSGALLMSLGFFSLGREKGLAKISNRVVSLANTAVSLTDKLAQTFGHTWKLDSEGRYVTELGDIAEANRLAQVLNKRFCKTAMQAKPEIDTFHRYHVVLSNVTYQALEQITVRREVRPSMN